MGSRRQEGSGTWSSASSFMNWDSPRVHPIRVCSFIALTTCFCWCMSMIFWISAKTHISYMNLNTIRNKWEISKAPDEADLDYLGLRIRTHKDKVTLSQEEY